MRSDQTVYDAWIVGVHEVPADMPTNLWTNLQPGTVILHTRRENGRWFTMDTADFTRDFEWIVEADTDTDEAVTV